MTDLEIYQNAPKGVTPEELSAYLDEACGGDADLRVRVEAHFAVREKIGDFLDPAALNSEATTIGPGSPDSRSTSATSSRVPAITEKEGDTVGPYKLLQKIGEGGFGVVWMAEQSEPISRKVALKVVKPGMDTREVLARFEAERQALALMDDPNIARVIDAGSTGSGRPYFAMELVKGIPITKFCDERKLNTRQRLELLRDVCSAVNHAHQKGIIHRDLKPSNVLVTLHGDKPVVKVIDFGIAKATQGKLTDKTLFTRFEQFVGTPVYMSPEQAAMSGLDIDTRSDIYSLGVLLYELLAGGPPFDLKTLGTAGYDEMRRFIQEKEPPRPSRRLGTMTGEEISRISATHGTEPQKLQGMLRGDLDWIVMKAIEKDRARRYETANALRADIGRYLENEPVLAAAPSALYKCRKFAQRNKVAFSVAAMIAVVLVVATAVSLSQARWAIKAEELAKQRLTDSETARRQSDRAKEEAEAIATFLTEVFESPNPSRDGRSVTVAETLARAVEKLESDLASQPGRQAQLKTTLGKTYNALGLHREATPLFESVREFYSESLGPEHRDTLMAAGSLAISYSNSGRWNEALALREELLDLQRKQQDDPEHRAVLNAMYFLAKSYYNAGRRKEALLLGEEVVKLRRKVLGTEHRATVLAMDFLAQIYSETGREDEALTLREEVVNLLRERNGGQHPDTVQAMRGLAKSYAQSGRQNEVLALRENLLKLSREILGPDHPDTQKDRLSLAKSYAEAGRRSEALALREFALTQFRKVSGPEHPDTLRAMHELARSYEEADRLEEALEMREKVLEWRRKRLGPDHPDTLESMNPLAHSYSRAGRWDEALEIRQELLKRHREISGPAHPDTLTAMAKLAEGCEKAGRKEQAESFRQEIRKLEAGSEPPDSR